MPWNPTSSAANDFLSANRRSGPTLWASLEAPALHVDAAAWAAVLAIEKARRGIYNIAEPSGYLSTEKAQRELGFDASVRLKAVA